MLFNKLARNIQYDFRKVQRDTSKFMEELPEQLRMELSIVINENVYKNVTFFKGRDKTFLAWIGVILKQCTVAIREYIYKEGEDSNEGKFRYLLSI